MNASRRFAVVASRFNETITVRLADLVSDGTAAGLRNAVERLARDGAEALIVDLRGNPGGRLVTMMQAAGVFTSGFLWRAVMSWMDRMASSLPGTM